MEYRRYLFGGHGDFHCFWYNFSINRDPKSILKPYLIHHISYDVTNFDRCHMLHHWWGTNWVFLWNWVLYNYPWCYHNQLKIQIPTIGGVYYGFWQFGDLKIEPDCSVMFYCGEIKSLKYWLEILQMHLTHVSLCIW